METKYIIEVEDKPFELVNKDGITSEKLFRVKGFNSLVFDWNGLQMLTPYIEPDIELIKHESFERGYDSGYEFGKKDAEKSDREEFEHVYQKGLNDAWEAARKIWEYDTTTLKEIFIKCDSVGVWDILRKYSASEAIEKIRQYEQEQKELEEPKKEKSIRVEDVMRQYLDIFCNKCCGACWSCILNTSDFTCGHGYHFLTDNRVSDEEVRRAYATVLAKTKES